LIRLVLFLNGETIVVIRNSLTRDSFYTPDSYRGKNQHFII